MAGDWIKLEHATPDKPEVVQMAAILGVDHDAVVGKLLRMWIWADQNTSDGIALKVTTQFIDRLTFCDGFAAALRTVGWLEGRDGLLSIPNLAKALPEKRREEKRRENLTPHVPPELDTHAFKSAWDDWLEYRRQRKLKSYVPIGEQAQWSRLAKLGHDEAIAAIEHSIAQGFQGVYAEKGGKAAPSPNGDLTPTHIPTEAELVERGLI